MISVTKFAEERNEKSDTIRKYINRHSEIAEHTTMKEKNMMLDEVAVRMLEEIYPLPKPVEIIEDTESRLQLIKTQKLVIQLQNQLLEAQGKLAKAEATQLLLENKEKQIEKLEAENKDLKGYNEWYGKEFSNQGKYLRETEDKCRQIATELNEVKKMNIWQFMKYRKQTDDKSK